MVVDTLYRDAPVDKVELPFDLTDAISSAMRSVYKHHSSPEDLIPEELMDGITDILNAAITEDFTTDYPDFTDLIRKNNRVFAAFKTHDQCSRMAELLVDDSGKLKSYNDWVKEAEPISRHHNKVWLRTEYETAVKRAAQAEDWQQFEKDKDVLPNLRWVPSTAVSPAEDHRPFWGTVLPMNHSFWDNHRPGDRWGCQCSLESTDDKPTDMPHTGEIDFPPNDGLENNPGKDGKLFNDTHPYFPSSCNTCPFNDGTRKATPTNKKRDCASCKGFNMCQEADMSNIEKKLESLHYLKGSKYSKTLKDICSMKIFKPMPDEKNIYWIGNDKDHDFDNLLKGARKAVQHGNKVYILPNPNKTKSGDYIFERNKVYKDYDLKTISGKNSASNRMSDSIDQTRRVLLNMNTDYNPRQLATEIKKHFQEDKEAIEVLIYKGNKSISIKRQTVRNKGFEKDFWLLWSKNK